MYLKNEIVYLEGSCDDKIYVIYTGEFKLQKSKQLPNVDLTKRDEIGTTVLYLIREEITGLEACRNEPYRYTLQCDMDYSSLFVISLHRLDNVTKEKLLEILLPILKKKQGIEDRLTKRKLGLENHMKVTYRENNIMNRLKSIKTKEDLDVELKMTEDALLGAKEIVKGTHNEFKGFKLILKTEEKTRNKQPNLAIGDHTLHKTLDNAPPILAYNHRQKSKLFITGGTTIESSRVMTDRKKINSRFNSTTDFKIPTLNTIGVENDKFIKQTTSASKRVKVIKGESLKMILGDKFNMFKSFVSKIINTMDEKTTNNNKVVLSKNIRKNIKAWKNIVKNKIVSYSTGNIELPLLTQLNSI
jgi:hypothetical protein